tara:strand:+ start:1374 stop:1730 length:357 start_codon:yes stop_codon:yes gene_type:complete
MAQYIPFGTFTMVVTPHAEEQSMARSGVSIVEYMAIHSVNIPKLFEELVEDECFAISIGNLLLYIKRIYNIKRHRSELECISLTPSTRLHTHTKKFAKTVPTNKEVSNSAFPQWFNDE